MAGDRGHAELHGGRTLFTYTYSDVDAFLTVISSVGVGNLHRFLVLKKKKGVADTHRAAGPSRPGMTPSRTARPSSRTKDSCTPRRVSNRVTLAAP